VPEIWMILREYRIAHSGSAVPERMSADLQVNFIMQSVELQLAESGCRCLLPCCPGNKPLVKRAIFLQPGPEISTWDGSPTVLCVLFAETSLDHLPLAVMATSLRLQGNASVDAAGRIQADGNRGAVMQRRCLA